MKWYKPFEKEPPKDRPFLVKNRYKGYLILQHHEVFAGQSHCYWSTREGLHYSLQDFEKWTEIPKGEDETA